MSFRIRYQTFEFKTHDIHVRSLRDKQEFSDPLGEASAMGISSAQWSMFGVVWDSAQVLTRAMETFDIRGKRILEVGCGIALSSLLLNSRHADITATDYHPESGNFLIENVKLNNGDKIPFLRTDWANKHDGLGKFDVIIGADLLYEKQHIDLLANFINRHAHQQCEIILVDPGRGNHSAFNKKMISLGYTCSRDKPEQTNTLNSGDKTLLLRCIRV